MELGDLFVSYKQVDPVSKSFVKPDLPDPIYINLDRAREVTSGSPESTSADEAASEDMTTWKVGGSDDEDSHSVDMKTWRVPEVTFKGTPAKASTTTTTTPVSLMKTSEREKYWMSKFANYGLTQYQQLALLAAMRTECGLNPVGAVNRYELEHKGNTKGGWAHAGEGATQLTHWDTKKKYIEMFNADPRRKGEKLTTVESEYAKANTRHIADLDEDDQMLMMYLYYKPLIDRTKNETDFKNLVAEFYLQKAGRGFAKTGTSYERAVATGEHYQKTHARQGHTKAAQTNQFLKSLEQATQLAQSLGYSV